MPELRECIAHYFILLWFVRHCTDDGMDLRLIGLWCDATQKEAEFKKHHGMVYRLDSKSKVKRGTNNAQTSLWPEMWPDSGVCGQNQKINRKINRKRKGGEGRV